MILKKVHRGIKFYQSNWMEPYIRKNTELRKVATSFFEKDFFKLMNISVFGKTIENIRKRQNVILVDNKDLAYKLSSKPNFERSTIFDENLIACHMKKTEVYSMNQFMLAKQFWIYRKHSCLIFIITILETNSETKVNYYLQLDTDSLMYLIQQKMCIKISIKISIWFPWETSIRN